MTAPDQPSPPSWPRLRPDQLRFTQLGFRPADPHRDGGLLHDWLHQAHVVPWWGPERTLQDTVAYVERQIATGYLVPWLVDVGGTPFGYVEIYRAAEDPLAEAFPLNHHDRGWHVLVGPASAVGSGVPRLMGRAVLAKLFADPQVRRVVCEPDERNGRMLAYCRALGYEQLATLDLGHKRAALMACTREQYLTRWPGDLGTWLAESEKHAPPSDLLIEPSTGGGET